MDRPILKSHKMVSNTFKKIITWLIRLCMSKWTVQKEKWENEHKIKRIRIFSNFERADWEFWDKRKGRKWLCWEPKKTALYQNILNKHTYLYTASSLLKTCFRILHKEGRCVHWRLLLLPEKVHVQHIRPTVSKLLHSQVKPQINCVFSQLPPPLAGNRPKIVNEIKIWKRLVWKMTPMSFIINLISNLPAIGI